MVLECCFFETLFECFEYADEEAEVRIEGNVVAFVVDCPADCLVVQVGTAAG